MSDGPNDGPDISGTTLFNLVGKLIGGAAERALHELEIMRIKAEERQLPLAPAIITPPRKRGTVVELTAQQRVQRMLYLVQQAEISTLDSFVRKTAAPVVCPDIFYLLKDHNGGKDPTAPDPADRWVAPGKTFVNRTCDCIGGMCWCGGWDRFQPQRFAHIYGGWINTDSMCMEVDRVARGKLSHIPACFRRLPYPVPGCYVVCRSGTPGHKVGHIGGCIEVPLGLNLKLRDSWKQIKVVDVASRTPKKANALTTAAGWFGTDAYFIEPVMKAA